MMTRVINSMKNSGVPFRSFPLWKRGTEGDFIFDGPQRSPALWLPCVTVK